MRPLDVIKQKLITLNPEHLSVIDESHRHAHGNLSHFKVIIVSDEFNNLSLVKRHQLVYKNLGEFAPPNYFHALALHTYSVDEWEDKDKCVSASPNCAGA